VFRRETFVLEIEPPPSAERAGPVPVDESTSVAVALTFGLPFRYVQELEDIGETLDTFRALEVFEAQLTHGMRRTYLYFGGGVAVLALIVGTLLARQTVRRIARIEQAAARVAAGDLDVRVEAKGRDELAGLARQFNAMVEELQISQERVAYLQRVSAWQEIARRLAHEIKNPLTPILLAMQQLDRKFEELADAPERFRPLLSDALEIVQEEVGTLRALVKEFSEFARLPAVDPEPVVVASFLEDFVRTNPQLQQLAEIEVRVAPGCESLVADLDTTMMRRVLVNLTENATDAAASREDAEETGRPSTIELAVERKGDWVEITVRDEGCGIEEGQSEKVWDPYFTTKDSGTGLGLAIVKKIVLSHGGDAAICNRDDGPGCRVTLRFPLSPATPQPAGSPAGRTDYR
jgi:nitrogen fixation/metabolism regulation signal transduction histidine kinase